MVNINKYVDAWRFVIALVCLFSVTFCGLFAIFSINGHAEATETKTYFLGFSLGIALSAWTAVCAQSKPDKLIGLIAQIGIGYSIVWTIATVIVLLISWGWHFPGELIQILLLALDG